MQKISEVMTRDRVLIIDPEQPISKAAEMMAKADIGSLPVGEGDRMIGMVTDRDIVLRAVARGLGPGTRVRDVMTKDIKYCYDYEDVGEVTRNMADLGVRRLPVVNRDKRLVGIMALSNVAATDDGACKETLLRGVAVPH